MIRTFENCQMNNGLRIIFDNTLIYRLLFLILVLLRIFNY